MTGTGIASPSSTCTTSQPATDPSTTARPPWSTPTTASASSPPTRSCAPGSGVRRLLITRTDLIEDADHAGLTLTAFLRANAGRIAADLNAILEAKSAAA